MTKLYKKQTALEGTKKKGVWEAREEVSSTTKVTVLTRCADSLTSTASRVCVSGVLIRLTLCVMKHQKQSGKEWVDVAYTSTSMFSVKRS